MYESFSVFQLQTLPGQYNSAEDFLAADISWSTVREWLL